ncbi:MAG TPA: right-handed parallel beta-helix repeat-containing protein [Candidatus Kryptonia bacterium]|nr:right-handed parallel beta-helix repeat-containing protein [Candidatus Kryptonia bacterium]
MILLGPICALFAACGGGGGGGGSGGTSTANTLGDASTSGDGVCSLREAINNANSPGVDTTGGDCAVGTGNDTIVFSVNGTITLGSKGTLPAIVHTLKIDGGGDPVTVDGVGLYRVFAVAPHATLNLRNLTIAHGYSPMPSGIIIPVGGPFYAPPGSGAGVFNTGTLTVTDTAFVDDAAGAGGAIMNSGTLTITNSTFSGNNAVGVGGRPGEGGAIENFATTNVTNSTFVDNSPSGIENAGTDTLTVTDSTFSRNSAFLGGGIVNYGTLTVTGSTFSDNQGPFGAGISNLATATVTNSTFADNSDGILSDGGSLTVATITNSTFTGNNVGIFNEGGTLTVTNSILANSADGNCGVSDATIDNGGTTSPTMLRAASVPAQLLMATP